MWLDAALSCVVYSIKTFHTLDLPVKQFFKSTLYFACFRFFEVVATASPQARELLFLIVNSHYIAAVISPVVFILMIVMAVLNIVLKKSFAPYITSVLSILVSSTTICACNSVDRYSTLQSMEKYAYNI